MRIEGFVVMAPTDITAVVWVAGFSAFAIPTPIDREVTAASIRAFAIVILLYCSAGCGVWVLPQRLSFLFNLVTGRWPIGTERSSPLGPDTNRPIVLAKESGWVVFIQYQKLLILFSIGNLIEIDAPVSYRALKL